MSLAAPTPAYDGPERPTEPELFELRRTLRAGSNLMDLLLDADVRRPEADALVQSLRRVFNPRRLPAGITVRVAKRPVPGFEPRIAWLDIELPQRRHIRVEREEKGRFSSRITNEPPPPPAQPRAVAAAAAAAVNRAGVAPAPGARPVAPEPLPPSATRITVRSGDTLMAILRRQGIDRVEADRAIQAARSLFNLRRLRIGQEITLVTGIDETGADTLKTVALRVGDDRFVKVSRTADNHFEAARVDRLGLMTAPLERVRAAGEQPDGEPRRERTDIADRGHVMNAAFVAAAAPIASVPPGLEPQGAADPHSGAVNGVVNGTVNGAVIGALDGIAGAHLDPDDGLVRKAVVIRRGDTLSAALARAGGTREEAEAAIVAFRKVHNPRRLRVGQTLSLAFDPANGSNDAPRLASLALDVAADRDVVVTRADDGIFLSSVVDRPLERILQRTVGTIDANLYDTALAAGMPNQVLMEMVHIFSFDVDFQREIQPGDRFEVLYEAVFNTAGEFVENGPILYALLEVGEREVELFRYEPDEGPADYLDAKGASVRKALMRTPINGARLSSGYGMRRTPDPGLQQEAPGRRFRGAHRHANLCRRRRDDHDDRPPRQLRQIHPHPTQRHLQHRLCPPQWLCERHKEGQAGAPGAGHRLCRFHRNVDRAAPPLRGDAGQQADQPDDAQAALWTQAGKPRTRRVPAASAENRGPARRGAGDHARRPALTEVSSPRRPYAALARASASCPSMMRLSPPAETCTVSPSPSRPAMMSWASGFCRLRWITRCSGRAP